MACGLIYLPHLLTCPLPTPTAYGRDHTEQHGQNISATMARYYLYNITLYDTTTNPQSATTTTDLLTIDAIDNSKLK